MYHYEITPSALPWDELCRRLDAAGYAVVRKGEAPAWMIPVGIFPIGTLYRNTTEAPQAGRWDDRDV